MSTTTSQTTRQTSSATSDPYATTGVDESAAEGAHVFTASGGGIVAPLYSTGTPPSG